MAYVRRLLSVEYTNCSRSISFTFDPIHLEYTGGFHRIEAVPRTYGPWPGGL